MFQIRTSSISPFSGLPAQLVQAEPMVTFADELTLCPEGVSVPLNTPSVYIERVVPSKVATTWCQLPSDMLGALTVKSLPHQ